MLMRAAKFSDSEHTAELPTQVVMCLAKTSILLLLNNTTHETLTSGRRAVKLSWLENALTSKVGQTDLFLVCNRGSLVGLGTQKSVCSVYDLWHSG